MWQICKQHKLEMFLKIMEESDAVLMDMGNDGASGANNLGGNQASGGGPGPSGPSGGSGGGGGGGGGGMHTSPPGFIGMYND